MIPRAAWTLLADRRAPGWREELPRVRRLSSADPAEFARLHEAAIREHLGWAASAVPWHRGKVRLEDGLSGFPVLTRRDLQEHREALRDPSRAPEDAVPVSSGGSTGVPVRVYHDRKNAGWSLATGVEIIERWRLRPWARQAILWGDDRERPDTSWRARAIRWSLGMIQLNAFQMTEEAMADFADRMERLRPEFVHGYATALDLFASFLLRERRWEIRPRLVRSAAETLRPEVRTRIEAAFGCRVHDVYGSRECPWISFECPAGGHHVVSHGREVEVIDEVGASTPPGVIGRVLVTDLRNRLFALIRYENGDVASWAPPDPPCPCGCPFPRLERVYGRTSDFITLPDGERIHGEWFTHLFYEQSGVERFQVRQTAIERIEVLTTGPAGDPELSSLLERIRSRVGPAVSVEWRRVSEIASTPSGKYRFTVSDVPFLPLRRP